MGNKIYEHFAREMLEQGARLERAQLWADTQALHIKRSLKLRQDYEDLRDIANAGVRRENTLREELKASRDARQHFSSSSEALDTQRRKEISELKKQVADLKAAIPAMPTVLDQDPNPVKTALDMQRANSAELLKKVQKLQMELDAKDVEIARLQEAVSRSALGPETVEVKLTDEEGSGNGTSTS